jgi:glycerate 2-kinase
MDSGGLMVAWQQLRAALQAGVAAVDPARAVRRWVRQRDGLLEIGLPDGARHWSMADLRLLAIGKAAGPMAGAIDELLGAQILGASLGDGSQRALAIGPAPLPLPAHWGQVVGGHPLPDQGSLAAGRAIRQLLAQVTPGTVLLVCISGGATALVSDPLPGLSLGTLRSIYQALLASGAAIGEMNVVRSSLDRLKAGGLVALAQPAQVVALILSDVVGDEIGTIGSGLTAHPAAHNVLVGNNAQACQGAADYLRGQGYEVNIVTSTMEGEAKIVGAKIAQQIRQAPPGTALIYGGETTVTLPIDCGRGGRNQELVLAAALALADSSALVGAMGTDGIDGSSLAAGAIADGQTILRANELGMVAADYLERHDSDHFFGRLGEAIVTGVTGTNVADLVIALQPPKSKGRRKNLLPT